MPKISENKYYRGLLLYGSKFAFQNYSLIIGSKFTVFALFYFVFWSNFPSTSPGPGGFYLKRRFNGGFLPLPVGGAYIWKGFHMGGLNRVYNLSDFKKLRIQNK